MLKKRKENNSLKKLICSEYFGPLQKESWFLIWMATGATTFNFPLPKSLTVEEARLAIRDVVASFNLPENLERMNQARALAGEDMVKTMQFVLPVAMQIQQATITKYGFEPNQQGVMQFAMAINAHITDPEISQLFKALQAQFMPKGMTMPFPTATKT